jgi:hypothetical protein
MVGCSLKSHSAVLMMARIAALSGSGSFAQAVTTWDSSGLNGTEICVSLCVSLSGFPLFSCAKCGVRIPLSPPVLNRDNLHCLQWKLFFLTIFRFAWVCPELESFSVAKYLILSIVWYWLFVIRIVGSAFGFYSNWGWH